MKADKCCMTLALVAVILDYAFADSDTKTVQSEFDRCSALMERFERSLRRYENVVDAIKQSAEIPRDKDGAVLREAALLENRLEYFRNRFERARGQADKIRSDLKNVRGPTCPSCVESGVNMYCRNAETISNDIEEYLQKAADLQSRISAASVAGGKETSFMRRRSAADSSYRAVTVCDDRGAETLRNQAALALARADSLYSIKDTVSALKALDIAVSLCEKASLRCVKKK